MKKPVILSVFIMVCFTALAQQTNRVEFDTLKNQPVVLGVCTRAFLETFAPFNLRYQEEYNAYAPVMEKGVAYSEMLDGVTITIVLGTWCGDSREQLPRFFKVLDEIGYPSESLILLGTDGQKKIPGMDISGYGIVRVPTLIFHYKGKEIGRITETPVKSLEADLLDILKNKEG